MAGIDYLTRYSKGDFSVILKGDINEDELYSDLIREAMEHPVRFAPPIEIEFVTDDITTVKTNALLAEFLVHDESWNGEYKPKLETVYDFKKPNMFHYQCKNTLPNYVHGVLNAQNKALEDPYIRDPRYVNGGMEDVISDITQRELEYDAKVFWSIDEKVIQKGRKKIVNTAYILQYRTSNLRILAKVANNNFVTFFGKVTNPPTDKRELRQLEKKFETLRNSLFRSIYTKDEDGLINFYNFIKEEF